MPPNPNDHGERIAVVETEIAGLKGEVKAMKEIQDSMKETLSRMSGAWIVLAAIITFCSVVAGNVVSSRLIASPPAQTQTAK